MPFSLASICTQDNWKPTKQHQREREREKEEVNSPTPSPPTSASTLSSGGGKKEEWAAELQPILTAGQPHPTCEAARLEDWETTMWPDSGVASPTQEQSLLRWITGGDIDDTSSFGLKQLLLQSGSTGTDINNNNNLVDFESGLVDQVGSFVPGVGVGAGFSGFQGNGRTTENFQGPSFNSNGITPLGLTPVVYQHQPEQQHHEPVFESPEEKPQMLNLQALMTQHSQNPSFFMPLPLGQQHLLQPLPKRHNSGNGSPSHQLPKPSFGDSDQDFFLQQQNMGVGVGGGAGLSFGMGFPHQGSNHTMQFLSQNLLQPLVGAKQKVVGHGEGHQQHLLNQLQQQQQQEQQDLVEQLYKTAELVSTGNFSLAQGILARLNHQLSPVGKPLHRAAFYFKEALQLLLNKNSGTIVPKVPMPFDVIFKLGAYKVFSEASPLIQFVNFTSNQALLEALDDADIIHIVDFDVGFGAQWASFMQELPLRSKGAPALRITAFVSSSTHHPIELSLMRENLTQFANEVGLSFELEVVNFDSLEQTSYTLPILRSKENEAVAVNFPIWSSSHNPPALPLLLRYIKQLSPKIMVCLDKGCDRFDLPFTQHILQALQSYINLLESLDGINVNSDSVNKIERYLFQPKIENTVLGRLHSPEKMPLWKTLLASAGFSPLTFSNFTETQADCLVKRTQARGFHVEKCLASLVLCWNRRELISVSAWRC